MSQYSKDKSRVKLRAHHLMCVHGFQGKGYSPDYVKNFWSICGTLGEADARVEVVDGADEICAPCPNNDSGTCKPAGLSDEPRIRALDAAYESTLEVKPGDEMSFDELKKRIAENVTDQAFEKNCAPCSWKRFGYCKSALEIIRKKYLPLILVTLFCTYSAQAASKSSKFHTKNKKAIRRVAASVPVVNPDSVTPLPPLTRSDLIPAERVNELVNADKSRKFPAFAKILTALSKKKYMQALKECKAIEGNAEFTDYFHYLSGQAEAGRMEDAIKLKQNGSAIAAGERALTHFNQVASSTPYTPLEKKTAMHLGDVEMNLGELYLKSKKKDKARATFENGFQRMAEHGLMVLVPKSALTAYVGLCDKKPDDLCTSWEIKLQTLVPKPDRAKMFSRIAGISLPVVEKSVSIPYKVDMDLQAFQEGFTVYLSGKYPEAYGIWNELLKKYPRTSIKLRTKFWMGRAAQKSAQDARAETLYREVIREIPYSYYALMASWYSNIDVMRMIDTQLPMARAEIQLPTPADLFHVRRAEAFIASRAYSLACLELRDVKARDSMPNEFLVYLTMLNYLAENHMVSFQIASELNNRGYMGFISSYGEKMIFPTTFLTLIEGPAKFHKLDPYIVLSVIKQESAFNTEAISTSNAFGLMQIIPPTARDLDPKIEVAELFDPQKNVTLGAKYIRQLLQRYNGDIIWTLAGYNAGPGNADRWKNEVAAHPGLAPEEVIEFIGFRETHDYVQNILRNYYWYNKRLRGDRFVHLPALLQNFTANGN